jgi:hypothetical protein
MDTKEIIQAIDEEVFRLQQVRSLLTGSTAPLKRIAPAKKRRKISAEGRERMSAAQRARWAKGRR